MHHNHRMTYSMTSHLYGIIFSYWYWFVGPVHRTGHQSSDNLSLFFLVKHFKISHQYNSYTTVNLWSQLHTSEFFIVYVIIYSRHLTSISYNLALLCVSSPLNHKGYKCFNFSNKKLIISRHFIFDETQFSFTEIHHLPLTIITS